MSIRYLIPLLVTSLTLGTAAHAGQKGRPAPCTVATASVDLYSHRALRRARTLLQLKLLELREERLNLVLDALARHAPLEELLNDAPRREPETSITKRCRKT